MERCGMARRRLLVVLATVAFLVGPLALSGFSPGDDLLAATPRRGGILRVGKPQEPTHFDPHVGRGYGAWRIFELIYSTLVRFDQEMNIGPGLAESWETPDLRTYVFRLRKGVRFHHGAELTSDDVKFSFERILDPKVGAWAAGYFGIIDSVQTPDRYTVVIRLKRPLAPFLNILAQTPASIVSREFVTRNPGRWSESVSGTGPFKLKAYVPGSSIELMKFDQYYIKGRPYLDGIRFTFLLDATARSGALRSGTADMIEEIPYAEIGNFEKDPRFAVPSAKVPDSNYREVFFNVRRPPFDNRKVRQALNWALERQQILQTVVRGQGTVFCGPPFSASHWAARDVKASFCPQDLAKARRLLAEAGYPNGFRATLTTWGGSYMQDVAEVVQAQWRRIGVNIDLEPINLGVFLRRWRDQQFEVGVSGSLDTTGDPNLLYLIFHSSATGGPYGVGYSDPKVDRLLERASMVPQRAERATLYREALEIIVEDSSYAFLYQQRYVEAHARYVRGFYHMPNAFIYGLAEAWLDR